MAGSDPLAPKAHRAADQARELFTARVESILSNDTSVYRDAFARVLDEIAGDDEATGALIFALTGLAAGSVTFLAQSTTDDWARASKAQKDEAIRGCTAIVAEEFARRGIVG